ncbi:MAG: hypothetical protein ACK4Z6_03185 [Candidatus Methylomirabilales bacterium]
MKDHTLIFPVDSLLNTWILTWDYHVLGSRPLELFNANIFYPAKNTLALSEHMIGNLPIFAPLMFLTQNPILAANGVVFASFVLSGVAMFALVRYWTGNFLASFIAGFIYAFAPPRFGQLAHWQLLSVQWAPFALLFGEKFLRSRRLSDGLLALSFYGLQVLSSYYLGYAVTFVIGCYVMYRLIKDRSARSLEMLAKLTLLFAIAAVFIIPFSYPYVRLKKSGLLSHDPRLLTEASADPASSFLSVPLYGANVYQGLLRSFQSRYQPWEKWLFPGFLPVFLALVPVSRSLRERNRKEERNRLLRGGRWGRSTINAYLLIVLLSGVMSLGPFLVVNDKGTKIPLPYLFFFYLLPGFSSMRVPARFALMVPIGVSVLAGFGVQLLLEALRGKWARSPHLKRFSGIGLSSLLLFILTVEFHFTPIPMDPIEAGSAIPPVYRWLAHQPKDGAVLEVPWTIDTRRNQEPIWQTRYVYFSKALQLVQGQPYNLLDVLIRARYVYFSVYHWHPLVNGYSGYNPPSYEEIVGHLHGFPSKEGINYLSTIGVRRVILHTDLLMPDEILRWQTPALAEMGLEKAAEFGADVVFHITAFKSEEGS